MKAKLNKLYQQLLKVYGRQQWWPAETPFEVMVGAILTQNTAWTNVEKAIVNLKAAHCLDPQKISDLNITKLALLIKPAGYFNVKAKRLQYFCAWYLQQGGYEALKRWQTKRLRAALLLVHGIGPETADDILLYAFLRPVFVIDTYTKRILQRLGWITGNEDYETLRELVEQAVTKNVNIYNQYHALIVAHAKTACRKKPLCDKCHFHKVICQYA